jgi:hypothetical protein
VRDSKLDTNFEFCEEENHRHLKNTLIYKTKQFMMTKNSKEKPIYFRSYILHLSI